jgi:hypothetical protein
METRFDAMERSAERIALGNALEERTDDVLRWCQLEFVKLTGAAFEEVAEQDSNWSRTAMAV